MPVSSEEDVPEEKQIEESHEDADGPEEDLRIAFVGVAAHDFAGGGEVEQGENGERKLNAEEGLRPDESLKGGADEENDEEGKRMMRKAGIMVRREPSRV